VPKSTVRLYFSTQPRADWRVGLGTKRIIANRVQCQPWYNRNHSGRRCVSGISFSTLGIAMILLGFGHFVARTFHATLRRDCSLPPVTWLLLFLSILLAFTLRPILLVLHHFTDADLPLAGLLCR
jgi:uncharacterized membrane protein YidH (DUF202 family)